MKKKIIVKISPFESRPRSELLDSEARRDQKRIASETRHHAVQVVQKKIINH